MQEVFRHTLIKGKGNQKYEMKGYREAISDYIKASAFLLRYNRRVCLSSVDDIETEMYNKICGGPGYAELFYMLTLASCYNNIALCYIKLENGIDVSSVFVVYL